MTDEERLAEIDRWLGTPGTITKLMPRDVEEREEDVHALRRLLAARDQEIAELRLTHADKALAFDLMQERLRRAENAEAERDAALARQDKYLERAELAEVALAEMLIERDAARAQFEKLRKALMDILNRCALHPIASKIARAALDSPAPTSDEASPSIRKY